MTAAFILLLGLLVPMHVGAQTATPDPIRERAIVRVDLAKQTVGSVPFNQKTIWRGAVPSSVTEVSLAVGDKQKCQAWTRDTTASIVEETEFRIKCDSQRLFVPNRSYTLTFQLKAFIPRRDSSVDSSRSYVISLHAPTDRADPFGMPVRESSSLFFGLQNPIRVREHVRTASRDSFTKHQKVKISVDVITGSKHYITTDFGILSSLRQGGIHGVTQVNFHLGAVNPDTDLGESLTAWQHVKHRASFFVGIVPVTLWDGSEAEFDNLFGVGNLAFGISGRSLIYWPGMFDEGGRKKRFARLILQPIKVNAGFFVFAQDDANPLITEDRTKIAPALGISYDINLKALLAPLAGLLSGS